MAKKVYIDREAAENHMTIKAAQDRDSARRTWARAIASLADLPAADVVEVRHGRWVDNTPTTDEYGNPLSMVADSSKYIDLTCSVCGQKVTTKTNYCPNCGAIMDEVEE